MYTPYPRRSPPTYLPCSERTPCVYAEAYFIIIITRINTHNGFVKTRLGVRVILCTLKPPISSTVQTTRSNWNYNNLENKHVKYTLYVMMDQRARDYIGVYYKLQCRWSTSWRVVVVFYEQPIIICYCRPGLDFNFWECFFTCNDRYRR